MAEDPRRVYWDANVALSYLNGVASRVPIIEELFRQARAGEIELLTSAVSRVEVAFVQSEQKKQALDEEAEATIDTLWLPGGPIKTVEFYDLIGTDARGLIRQAVAQGWNLKPVDAIHLATAQRMAVAEMHTYCERLQRWSDKLGFPITGPQVAQGILGVALPDK